MKIMVDVAVIKKCLIECWSLQSSSFWTEKHPERGQCGVTALVIHDNFGGDILKTKLDNENWHYYNRIAGKRFDFTINQFENKIEYHDIISSREEAFTDTNEKQYSYLSSVFKKSFCDSNSFSPV